MSGTSSQYVSSEKISFAPHYRTITDGGKSHFSRVSDGLAEFIDNSIEACRKVNNIDCNIDINFNLYTGDSAGYCIISDNGIGMNFDKLREFAIYSLDQETKVSKKKDKNRDTQENQFISKYGVGAKEAGFFLGDRIKVTTRESDSNILEMTLDRDEFERKYNAGESAYDTSIYTRKYTANGIINNPNADTEEYSNSMLEYLNEIENNNKHFTYIVIKLTLQYSRTLVRKESYAALPDELSNIYHFYLHPEHLPNRVLDSRQFKKRSDGGCLSASHPDHLMKKLLTSSSSSSGSARGINGNDNDSSSVRKINDDTRVSNITMTVSINDTVRDTYTLKTVDSITSQFIQRAKSVCRFNMLVPLPNSNEYRNYSDSLTGAAVQQCLVEGILFYYPYDQGKETKPTNTSSSIDLTASIDDNSQISSQSSDIMEVEVYNPAPVFNVYWVGRQVPESEVKRLPFFINASTASKDIEIPQNWLGRVKGYLFFERTFPVTNNKLRIQIDPDINTWLNDSRRKEQMVYKPKTLSSNFITWIKACHKEFDKEYLLEVRHTVTADSTDYTNIIDVKDYAFFNTLRVGSSNTVSAGDVIQIVEKKQKGNRDVMYLKIDRFILKNNLNHTVNSYNGSHAQFLYRRMPTEVYGSGICDRTLSIRNIDINKCTASDVDVNKLKKHAPKGVCITLFEDVTSVGVKLDPDDKVLEVQQGKRYYKMGIQVLDASNHHMIQLPGVSRKLKVQLSITGIDKNNVTDDLWQMTDNGTEIKNPQASGSTDYSSMYYGFYYMHFYECERDLECKALIFDDNRVVLERVFYIRTIRSKIGYLFEMNTTGTYRLSQYIPSFKVTIVTADTHDPVIDYTMKVKYELTCISHPEVELICLDCDGNILKDGRRGLLHPSFKFESGEDGVNEFDEYFVTDITPILISKNKGYKLFNSAADILLQCSINLHEYASEDKKAVFQKIGETKFFSFKLSPGGPVRLNYSESELQPTLPVSCDVDATVTLQLACYDKYGHLTAPASGKVWEVIPAPFGIMQSTSKCIVTTVGTVTLASLKCKDDITIPLNGLSIDQIFYLLTDTFTATSEEYLKDPNLLISLPMISVPMRVLPNIEPSKVFLYIDGVRVTDELVRLPGEVIGNISYKVIDNNDNELDFDDKWFTDERSNLLWSGAEGVITSNNTQSNKKGRSSSKSRRANTLQVSYDLPDIHLPNIVSVDDNVLSYDLTLYIHGFQQLTESLYVKIELGPGTKWSIVTAASKLLEGIRCADTSDLLSKILGVYLLDANGNRTIIPSDAAAPLMKVRWHGEDASDTLEEQILELVPTAGVDGGHSHYQLHPDSAIVSAKTPVQITISVSDPDDTYSDTSIDTILIASHPCIVALSSTEYNLDEAVAQEYSIDVFRHNELTDFKLHLLTSNRTKPNDINKYKCSYTVTLLDANGIEAATLQKSSSLKDSVLALPRLNLTELLRKCKTSSFDFFTICYTVKAKRVDCSNSSSATMTSSVHLQCHLIHTNELSLFEFYSISTHSSGDDTMSTVDLIPSNKLTMSCDQILLTIGVKAVADSGARVLKGSDDMKVVVKKKSHIIVNSYIEVPVEMLWADDPDNNVSLLTISFDRVTSFASASAGNSHNCVGKYTITVTDANTSGSSSTGALPVSNTLSLDITPLAISCIRLDDDSARRLSHVTIYNTELEAARMIAKSITVLPYDKYGNVTVFPSDATVVCTLEYDDDSIDVGGNRSAAYFTVAAKATQAVTGTMEQDQKKCRFPQLQIEYIKDDVEFTSNHQLLFTVNNIDTDSSNSSYSSSDYCICIPITFQSGRNVSDLAIATTNELKTCSEEVNRYYQGKSNQEQMIDDAIAQMKSLLAAAKDIRLSNVLHEDSQGSDASNVTASAVERILHDLESQSNDMNNLNQVRAPKAVKLNASHTGIINSYKDSIIGQIVKLAYVDEEDISHIISWILGRNIDAFVCKTDDCALSLYRKGIKSCCIKSYQPFTVVGSNKERRVRSEDERNRCMLPLKAFAATDAGNPEYIINVIKLSPENEHLRDTLFWSLLKETILIDDMASAQALRSKSVSSNKPPMTIYCRTGERLLNDGVLNPNASGCLPVNAGTALGHIFGQLHPHKTKDFKQVQEDIVICNELIECINKKSSYIEAYNSLIACHESDISSKKTRINQLKSKLAELDVITDGNGKGSKSSSKRGSDYNVAIGKRSKR